MPPETMKRYSVLYLTGAVQTIRAKRAYIASQFHSRDLAGTWYQRLRREIQENLSGFPKKYPVRRVVDGVELRLLIFRNDVVVYHVDDAEQRVCVHAVCTRGVDIDAFLDRDTAHTQE